MSSAAAEYRRSPAWLLAAAVAAAAGPALATDGGHCTWPRLEVSAGVVHHRWTEFDAAGKRLLREQGSLPRLGVGAGSQCGKFDAAIEFAVQQGDRAYAGVTNFGRTVTTDSAIRQRDLAASLWWTGHSEHWAPGLRLTLGETRRRLRSAGAALGYPERHRQAAAAVGLRWTTAPGAGPAWTVQSWLGGHPGGRVRIDLPQADPTTLRSGRSLQFDGRMRIAWAMAHGARFHVELTGSWHDTASGAARALTQDGRLVGTARQPRTRVNYLGVSVGTEW